MISFLMVLMAFATQDETIDWGRPFFGMITVPIDSETRKQLKQELEEHFKVPGSKVGVAIGSKGVIVQNVSTEFKGLVNNLQKFDVIQKVGETVIEDKDSLQKALSERKPGEPVDFSILRPALIKNRVSFESKVVKCTPISAFIHVTSNYEIDEDKFKKITFYQGTYFRKKPMSVYVGKTADGEIYQMVRFRWDGVNGLKGVEILVDGEVFKIEATLKEMLDNTVIGGNSHEWFDRPESELIGMMKRIESAKEVTIRMRSRAEYEDFDVTEPLKLNLSLNKQLIQALKWEASQK